MGRERRVTGMGKGERRGKEIKKYGKMLKIKVKNGKKGKERRERVI